MVITNQDNIYEEVESWLNLGMNSTVYRVLCLLVLCLIKITNTR